ncbi:MAG: hypothetical protein AAF799_16375 [Myxococcota bacterium]
MVTLRTIALASAALCVSCNGSSASSADEAAKAKPAPAATAKPRPKTPTNDPHAIAKAMDAKPEVPLPPTVGTFDATIDGEFTHFLRMPRGQNRAVAIPDHGVARVSVGAAVGHEGWPHIRLTFENLFLDAAEFPVTLPSKDKGLADVSLKVRYQVSEQRVYAGDASTMKVTLESWVGTTLSGTFEGTLTPTAAGLGDPIPVSGKFETSLGLRGVRPGPSPDGTPVELVSDGHALHGKSSVTPPPKRDEKAPAEPAQPPL